MNESHSRQEGTFGIAKNDRWYKIVRISQQTELCVKPIFTIGIKHKKIVSILYKIMKECKNI